MITDEQFKVLEALAQSIFDPALLLPNSDGKTVLLGRVGRECYWETTGYRDGWQVEHPDGRAEVWPDDEVYSPYDQKALAHALFGQGVPVRDLEDPEEKVARVRRALGVAGLKPGEWAIQEAEKEAS